MDWANWLCGTQDLCLNCIVRPSKTLLICSGRNNGELLQNEWLVFTFESTHACTHTHTHTHALTHSLSAGVPSPLLSINRLTFTSCFLLHPDLFHHYATFEKHLKGRENTAYVFKMNHFLFNTITSISYKVVMSLTFLLCSPGCSGLSHFGTNWFVSVLLLDRQRDDGNLWKFLSPPWSVLLNEHLGDSVRRHRE